MSRHQERIGSVKTDRSNTGFSLVELLIVVAVILVIAAIAIPNFIRSKMRASEAAAAQDARSITTAEVIYSTTYGIGFSGTLAALGGSSVIPTQSSAGLIDTELGGGKAAGYTFTYGIVSQDSQGHVNGYSLNVDPITPSTGQRHFYTDQTAVIRSNSAGPAGPSDPPLQ
jgi:type IV pilus assembly protein PilA